MSPIIEYDGLLEEQWTYLAHSIKSREESDTDSFSVYHVQLPPPSINLGKAWSLGVGREEEYD